MLAINARITGLASIEQKLAEYERQVRDAAFGALQTGALIVVNIAKRKILRGPKTGRWYRRGKRRHRASAPGQPPASDTGRLVNAISSRANRRAFTIAVVANTKYAAALEYGTRRMRPRPFLRASLKEARPEIVRLVREAVRNARRAAA